MSLDHSWLIRFSGNVVGYHVERPCRPCLQSQNNGHYWMFYRVAIIPGSRLNKEGKFFKTPLFFYRKFLFKIVFGQNFFNCQRFFNFAAHFRTNQAPNFAKKIFCLQLNEIKDTCERPFSETRNCTLNP